MISQSPLVNFVGNLNDDKYNRGNINNFTLDRFLQSFGNYGDSAFAWYQRADIQDDVWRRSFLTSVMKGKTPSPIVINRVTLDSGEKIYRVIDGGHRYRAILRFMNNEYYFIVPETNQRFYYSKITNTSLKHTYVMTDEMRDSFDSLTVPILEYKGLTEVEEHEIFIDFNKTTKLVIDDHINAVLTTFMKTTMSPFYEQTKTRANKLVNGMKFNKHKKWLSFLCGVWSYVSTDKKTDVEINSHLVEYMQGYKHLDDPEMWVKFTKCINETMTIAEKLLAQGISMNSTKLVKQLKKYSFIDIFLFVWNNNSQVTIMAVFTKLNNLTTDEAVDYYSEVDSHPGLKSKIMKRHMFLWNHFGKV